MIEQSLFNSNFIGRDGFKWWIGQVADPDISGWGDSTTLVQDEECQYYRVKVRILGYHPASQDVLPDKDLPFAHVLVPLTEGSGVNGIGKLHQIQGGETVLGFFMDGDDGQQPVIFSAFYRQKRHIDAELFGDNIEDYSFRPYSESKRYSRHTHLITKQEGDTSGGTNVATGTTTTNPTPTKQPPGVTIPGQTKADAMFNSSSDVTISLPSPCGSNSTSQIQKFLNDFMKTMREIQQFKDIYLNPIFDAVVNLDDEILLLSKRILGVVSAQVQRIREKVIDKVGKAVAKAFGATIPKSTHSVTGIAVRKSIDVIFCIFETLLDSLLDIILEVMNGLLNKLFDIVQCTVDNVLSQIYDPIESFIQENLTPILNSINDIVGGALGTVDFVLSESLQYAGLIKSILDGCDNIPCPSPSTWSASSGPKLDIPDNWFETIERVKTQDFSQCDNSLICGSQIVFSGGGGFGAVANLIVNNSGSIIGADVIDGGTSYVDSPFVSVEDNCGGNGSELIAIVKDKKVEDIVVSKPGKNYSQPIIRIPSSILVGSITRNSLTSEDVKTNTVEFKVSLSRKPNKNVELTLESSDPSEGKVFPSNISFDKDNWKKKVSVRVTGIDDDILDGDIPYKINIVASSEDLDYQGKTSIIDLINIDNEVGDVPISTPSLPPGNEVGDVPISTPSLPPGVIPKDDTPIEFKTGSGNQDVERGIGPNSKCAYIYGVYVKNPGYNYSSNDEIIVVGCDGKQDNVTKLKFTVGPGNGIAKVDVITTSIFCGCSPKILINSDTGSGAVLIPILRYRGPRPVGPSDISKVQVVNCVSK